MDWALISHGVICTLDETIEAASRAEGDEVSVRVLGVLETYDADAERGWLVACEHGRKKRQRGATDASGGSTAVDGEVPRIEVDFSALCRDEASAMQGTTTRAGSRVCVIGEAYMRGIDGVIGLRARVARLVDGLDVQAYVKALKIRREYLKSA